MAVVYETGKIPSDILALDFDPTYNYVSAPVKAPTDDPAPAPLSIGNVIGYPVILAGTDYVLALAADAEDVAGIIVDGPPIKDLTHDTSTKAKYKILVRGPAAIRPSGIAADDYAGDPITAATIITALKAFNPPVLTVDEAPIVEFTSP